MLTLSAALAGTAVAVRAAQTHLVRLAQVWNIVDNHVLDWDLAPSIERAG